MNRATASDQLGVAELKLRRVIAVVRSESIGIRATVELAETVLGIRERSKTIQRLMPTREEVAAKPGPKRPMPIEDYLRQRVEGQIEWYRKRARELGARKTHLQYGAWGIGAIGTIMGLLGSFGWSGATLWVAAATTIGSALVAYAAASRLEFQIQAYQSTADRLMHAASIHRAGGLSDSALVLQSEEIITSENAAWVAEYRSGETGSGSPLSAPPG